MTGTPAGEPEPPRPPDDAYQFPSARPFPPYAQGGPVHGDVRHPGAPGFPPYPTAPYPAPPYPTAPYLAAPYPAGPYPTAPHPTAHPYRVSPPTGTNGQATASLITAVVGIPLCFLFGIPSLVAVVLGVIALTETGRTGQQGRGLAIAGIAVGAATFLLVVLGFVLLVTADGNAGGYYGY